MSSHIWEPVIAHILGPVIAQQVRDPAVNGNLQPAEKKAGHSCAIPPQMARIYNIYKKILEKSDIT
jgi:hypothetical protein